MKILIISALYDAPGGGAGLMAYYLAHELHEAGHQVSVIATGAGRSPFLIEERGVRIYRFQPANLYPLEEKDLHPLWQKMIWQIMDVYNFHCADVFQKILLNESPDVVHIHKMRGFSGAVWSVAARLLPGRVIQTCHDYESMSPDGLLRGSIGRMAVRKQWPLRGYQLIRARLSAGVSVVTAPSHFTLQRVADSGLFPAARTAVIPNTHGWSREKLRWLHQGAENSSRKTIRFLYLGRLEREKGIIELCEAFLQVVKSHPSMQLDIAGWGTLEPVLRAKYDKCAGINFLGVLVGEAKENALRSATAIVVPSLVEEVFGLVTVEAFGFGKPVIASRVGGLPELVREGETGWLVEAGNVPALAERLAMVADMPSGELMKIGDNCRLLSYEFSIEKVLGKYENIYHLLLG